MRPVWQLKSNYMPKKIISLDDHTQYIIETRQRSQSGRFQAVAAGTALVGDVVISSCAAVAAAFVSEGFRWAKSGLRFSRKVGDFTHTISFQPDSANTSGQHIAVSMHAQVKSSALEKWRDENQGVTLGPNVWITQAGYLSPAREYFEWQLVDPVIRSDEISDMIETVRNIVLPAFDACSSIESLSDSILDRREIIWIPDWALDVALWVGNRNAAENLVKIFLDSKTGLASRFHTEYEQQCQTPLLSKQATRFQSFVRLCINQSLHISNVG